MEDLKINTVKTTYSEIQGTTYFVRYKRLFVITDFHYYDNEMYFNRKNVFIPKYGGKNKFIFAFFPFLFQTFPVKAQFRLLLPNFQRLDSYIYISYLQIGGKYS